MAGYMNEDLAEEELKENDWWKMGDIGYYDDNGYLYFVSRMKDILKYRGVQVCFLTVCKPYTTMFCILLFFTNLFISYLLHLLTGID